MSRKGFRCFECDGSAHHAHHVIPYSKGGTRTIPLCEPCHSKVHDQKFSKSSELIKEGMRRAAKAGRRVAGHNVVKIDIDLARRLLLEGLSHVRIGRILDVSERTIRRKLGLDKAHVAARKCGKW